MTKKKDPLQRRIEAGNWLILVLLAGGGLCLGTGPFGWGIIGGGLLSVANFHWLCRDLVAVFDGQRKNAQRSMMLRYFLRLSVSAFILWFLIAQKIAGVVGLVIGLSVVPLNMIITACWAVARGKSLAGAK